MSLYHFCCAHSRPGVMADGITLGTLALFSGDRVRLSPNCQWLTSDPDWDAQRWADRVTLKCDRTEFRATVEIPEEERHRLRNWDATLTMLRLLGCSEEAIREGYTRPGCEAWHTYAGPIPRKWITAMAINPRLASEAPR